MSYPFTSALVTGASSGIGEATVRLLAAEGVPTVVVARRAERLEALAGELDGIEVLAADLTDGRALARVAKRVGSATDPVDLVVNNAGFGTSGAFLDADSARLSREIDLNVAALTRLSHAAATAMRQRGRGFLLNVSSVASFQPVPNLAVYAATKAYVTSLTESLHHELASSGVHVTALCPGLTRTEFVEVSSGEAMAGSYPGFAWMDAADVAADGLRDVAANRPLSVPGALYKGLVAGSNITPRWMMRRITSLVQRVR